MQHAHIQRNHFVVVAEVVTSPIFSLDLPYSHSTCSFTSLSVASAAAGVRCRLYTGLEASVHDCLHAGVGTISPASNPRSARALVPHPCQHRGTRSAPLMMAAAGIRRCPFSSIESCASLKGVAPSIALLLSPDGNHHTQLTADHMLLGRHHCDMGTEVSGL